MKIKRNKYLSLSYYYLKIYIKLFISSNNYKIMSWWKKDEREKQNDEPPILPELSPKLPKLPELPEESTKLHPLPSFPSSLIGEKIGQAAVKNAVEDKESAGIYEKDDYVTNMEESPRTLEISEQRRHEISAEPVFIQIDKYEKALEHFNIIKKKISETEKLLVNIKEIKTKEDFELEAWEKDISNIKSRISDIENSVFARL